MDKKREIWTQTHREGPRDNRGEMERCIHKPRDTEGGRSPPPDAGRGGKGPPLSPSPPGSRALSHLDSQLPASRTVGSGLDFCCFKSPVCGASLWRPPVALTLVHVWSRQGPLCPGSLLDMPGLRLPQTLGLPVLSWRLLTWLWPLLLLNLSFTGFKTDFVVRCFVGDALGFKPHPLRGEPCLPTGHGHGD